MERSSTILGWSFTVTDRIIILGKLKFTPSESNKITGLLGFAGGMANLKALPTQIEDTPFIIEFDEGGKHRLSREDTEQALEFMFEQTDDLIKAIQSILAISVDIQKIQPSIIPRGTIGPEPADWFEGKT